MLLIPAIDLKNGFCVRLKQGNMKNVTIFSKKPEKVVLHWLNQGAKKIHLIDLDGAIVGFPKNYLFIKKIFKIIKNFCKKKNINKIPIQLGGGIRKLKIIEKYINLGISKIIIGTAAIENYEFLKKICLKFPKKIIVSIDVKDNLIAIKGWKKYTNIDLLVLIKKIIDCGCNTIIYTDIKRDGMMNGVNLKIISLLSKFITTSFIISGGVYNIQDIKNICNLNYKNIKAIICGRSIYEGTLDLKISQKYIDDFYNKKNYI